MLSLIDLPQIILFFLSQYNFLANFVSVIWWRKHYRQLNLLEM